jgi:hypothetical protein
MAFIGFLCFPQNKFNNYLQDNFHMRGILVFLALGLLLAGCAAEEDIGEDNITVPVDNITVNDSDICSGPVCGTDGITYQTDCDAYDMGMMVDYLGECFVPEIIKCNETDGGIDLEKRGKTSKGNESFLDYCVDDQQLVEYTCLDNDVDFATFICGENRTCEDGRCVVITEPESVPDQVCRGPLTVNTSKRENATWNGTVYKDLCVESKIVKDYYCRDGKLESLNNQCDPGFSCKDGICMKEIRLCTDSDGGINLSVRARVIVSRGFTVMYDDWDECIDEGSLREHYCLEDDNGNSSVEECGPGFKCAGGRCLESNCQETDEGRDIYERGTTSIQKQDISERDKCMSDWRLKEYYCWGDDIEIDDILCPDDHICDNGRCVRGEIK